MEFSGLLFVKGDPDTLFECFAPEEKDFERSSFTITKKEDGIEFNVKANDAVALRATLNSISQLLIVFEGAKKE